jgi:DNA-binding transcriptional LysR family regulator
MNTDYIRYMKMIAQEGNVSRAAAALFISQPALLKALNKMEARLKIKLFTREKRHMILTEAGKVFLADGEKILALEDILLKNMEAMSEAKKETVTLGIPGERGANVLPLLLPLFHSACPDHRLKTVEGYSEMLENYLLDGTIDLALYTLPVNTESLAWEKLADEYVVIGASKHSSFAQKFDLSQNSLYSPYYISPQMLKGTEFNLVKEGRGTRRIAEQIFAAAKIHPAVYQEYDRHQTLVRICSITDQLCITPCHTPLQLGIADDMCFFTTERDLVNRQVIIAWLKDRKLSKEEKKLIGLAKAVAQKVGQDDPCSFRVVDAVLR